MNDVAFRTRNIMSLCAGVGGLEFGISLALRLRGEASRGICYLEREASAAASLVASMEAGWIHPAPIWSELTTFDARPWRGLVHILASGDPCQENSVAGKRAGASGIRFLAPEVVRIAEECGPDIIFRENVPGNAGEQLAAIVPALERLGYCVAAGIFSSAETGNTMRRERLFIMASRRDRSLDGTSCGRKRGNCGELSISANADVPSGSHGSEWHAINSSPAMVCAESIGWRQGRPEPEGEQGRCAIASTSSPVAGTIGGELQRWGGSSELRREEGAAEGQGDQRQRDGGFAGNNGGEDDPMGGSSSSEPQGQQRGQHHTTGRQVKGRPSALSSRATIQPAVIPGPTDSRWRDVLDQWPELQPALSQEEAESHLRRGIDAMAHRVERLRATGNGVDPVVAAYAFLRLSARLAER